MSIGDMKNKRYYNNHGFSIVELVVVIAIMSLLVALTSFGVGMLSGRPAQKASARFKTNVERTRTITMGRTSAELTLFVTDDGIFTKETVDGTTKDSVMLAPASVICSYTDGIDVFEMTSGDSVTITFNRSDGSLSLVSNSDGTDIYKAGVTKTINNVGFCFTKANKKYNVNIVPVTGRVAN